MYLVASFASFVSVLLVICLMMLLVVACREWSIWIRTTLSREYGKALAIRLGIILTCTVMCLTTSLVIGREYLAESDDRLFRIWAWLSIVSGIGFLAGLTLNRSFVPR